MSPRIEPDATRSQIRGSTLLLAGRGLSVGLNFLTQVLTVRYLVKEDYGSLAYALAMASFFGKISRFGMDKVVSRIAAIQDEQRDYAKMFGTLVFAVILVVLCGSAIALGATALGDSLGPAMVTDPLSLNLLLILIVLAPVEALDHLMQSVFAIFSKPRLIFFRKHVVGPTLKLVAVLSVMLTAGDARTLAIAYLIAGVLGLAIGLSLAGRVLKERNLLVHFQWRGIQVRVREILGYGLPMLGSDAVLLLRGALVVFLLEFAHGSAAVADFRAVLPVARLNNVALESFAFMFVPAVARLTAMRDSRTLNDMYWRSSAWVTILTLPIFLVTFCLASPVTVFLFSERYAGAAVVLAILSVGAFLDATLAMSGQALKAAGRVREVLIIDGAALTIGLVLAFVLVPRFGAVGGAVAVSAASVAHGLTYHVVLSRTMHIRLFPTGFGRIYGTLGLVALTVWLLETMLSPPLWVQLPLVAVAWLLVLLRLAPQLGVRDTFPELLRMPLLGHLLERVLARSQRNMSNHSAAESEITDALEHAVAPFTQDIGEPPHRVRLRRTHRRPGSTILECDLTGSSGRVPVLVKTVDGDEASIQSALQAEPDFPRLGRREHPGMILTREGTTLRAIHDHFTELGDPRFESVRVFDVVRQEGLVAMERLPYPTLHARIQRYVLRPWARRPASLLAAAAHSGGWLRAFHAMPRLDHTEPLHTTRSDFLSALQDLSAYISDSGADPVFLARIENDVSEAALWCLPEELPCGLAHGDYAPRNVLVGPDERVSVIDTPGRWWSTIYFDLGYFLANTRTLTPCVLTFGMAPSRRMLDAIEQSFLQGYFGADTPDWDAVRLYEILTLMARWASGIHAQEHGAAPRRLFYKLRERHIRACLSHLLDAVDGLDAGRAHGAASLDERRFPHR